MDFVERFRQIAVALPEAIERSHVGATDFRLHGRILRRWCTRQKSIGTLKLTTDQQANWIAEAPQHFEPAPGGWGRMGLTLVRLDAPVDVLEGAVRVSYNNVRDKQQAKKRVRTGNPSRA